MLKVPYISLISGPPKYEMGIAQGFHLWSSITGDIVRETTLNPESTSIDSAKYSCLADLGVEVGRAGTQRTYEQANHRISMALELPLSKSPSFSSLMIPSAVVFTHNAFPLLQLAAKAVLEEAFRN